MYLLYVLRHWFVAIPDPEVRSSGRVKKAAFAVPLDLTSGSGGGN